MKIVYWSDYACPYCYIGETRLKKAIDEVLSDPELSVNEPIELEMRAFRLDPSAGKVPESDTVTRYGKKYHVSPMLAQHQVEKISILGRREGLEFNYGSTLFSNTMDAHRLTKLAYTKGNDVAEKLIELLFKAYFADNKILADKDVLIKAGTEAGLNEKEITDMLATDEYMEHVLADEREAHARGVTGVPYFEINDSEQIYGAEHTEGFKKRLLKILSPEPSEGTSQDKGTEQGHVCGPDGCKL